MSREGQPLLVAKTKRSPGFCKPGNSVSSPWRGWPLEWLCKAATLWPAPGSACVACGWILSVKYINFQGLLQRLFSVAVSLHISSHRQGLTILLRHLLSLCFASSDSRVPGIQSTSLMKALQGCLLCQAPAPLSDPRAQLLCPDWAFTRVLLSFTSYVLTPARSSGSSQVSHPSNNIL